MSFNLLVEGIPYVINASKCYFNSELQYRVSLNGSEDVFFAFNDETGRYTASGDNSIIVPAEVEQEIGAKLNSNSLRP